jgi:hypothetical protein
VINLLIPPQYRLLAGAVALLGVIAVSAYGGWYAQGLAKDAVISGMQTIAADTRAAQAVATLADMATSTRRINDAATRLISAQDALGGKIETIKTNFGRATKSAPLVAGCRPDDERVRLLSAAVDAANAARAGQPVESAVPSSR